MRLHTFVKGAFAGGVGATAVLAATAAFAGTGVGGVFNLGQSNSVNATSTLTGARARGAPLQVTNRSTTAGATGLSVTSGAGKPPLTVSNTTVNPKLNAQYVGGYAPSALGRGAMASTENLFGSGTADVGTTVSITAPKAGFVRLDGRILAYDGFSNCNDCQIYLQLHDNTTGKDSPISFFEGGNGVAVSGEELYVSWVFPVSAAGVHTYSLKPSQLAFSGNPYQLFNPVLVAQFVPFGATGTSTSLSPAPETLQGPARTVPTGR